MKKKDETLDWRKPSFERLMVLAKNLQEKTGSYATVQYNAWKHESEREEREFYLGGGAINSNYYYSWDDLLKAYRRIMYG